MYTVLSEQVSKLKSSGKTIGLITGCFDIVHLGHLRLFEKALEEVDCLVIGLESDGSICRSKGRTRPIFDISYRSVFINHMLGVLGAFEIPEIYRFSDPVANMIHKNIVQEIKPTSVITCVNSDKYWKQKRGRATEAGVEFMPVQTPKCLQTTGIIDLVIEKTLLSHEID